MVNRRSLHASASSARRTTTPSLQIGDPVFGYFATGQRDKAIALEEQVLTVREDVFGAEDAGTIHTCAAPSWYRRCAAGKTDARGERDDAV